MTFEPKIGMMLTVTPIKYKGIKPSPPRTYIITEIINPYSYKDNRGNRNDYVVLYDQNKMIEIIESIVVLQIWFQDGILTIDHTPG